MAFSSSRLTALSLMGTPGRPILSAAAGGPLVMVGVTSLAGGAGFATRAGTRYAVDGVTATACRPGTRYGLAGGAARTIRRGD